MSITMQILTGSLLLGLCSLIHILLITLTARFLGRLTHHFEDQMGHWRSGVLIACTFAVIVLSHTVQTWIWAFSFILLGVLKDMGDAIYFSLVTYTTVGYGDVTVDKGFRIFAAMASVTGLLNFGLSTAFLVGLTARLLAQAVRQTSGSGDS